jgi:sugar/nucleoside kinase (ribokinase family)
MNKIITVIGSSNTDMVVKSKRLPAPGETILGGEFGMYPGGKGANQAVAAARLGGTVHFVGRRGDDIFGTQASSLLNDEGIETTFEEAIEYLETEEGVLTAHKEVAYNERWHAISVAFNQDDVKELGSEGVSHLIDAFFDRNLKLFG